MADAPDAAPRVAALRQAWEEAADDLDIRVTTEEAQMLDPFGQPHSIVALLPDFGGGMHIFEEWNPLLAGVLWERHQGFTTLFATYEKYDRSAFIDALCDWGWTGDDAPPPWYVEPEQTS